MRNLQDKVHEHFPDKHHLLSQKPTVVGGGQLGYIEIQADVSSNFKALPILILTLSNFLQENFDHSPIAD